MISVTEKAYGKLNLLLDVHGLRDDGYHEMSMIMQSVDLCDDVTVTVSHEGNWICRCNLPNVPSGMENLALRAADVFFQAYGNRPAGVEVVIHKRIPMQGGMAGGSADAAAVLRGLNRIYDEPFSMEELAELGAAVGSDVPYCVINGTVLARGRGEILKPLPKLPDAVFVLVRPDFSVSTPELFRRLDSAPIEKHPDVESAVASLKQGDLTGLCNCIGNVFQPVLSAQYPVIDEICARLDFLGAKASALTGTGSVVFGVFDDAEIARKACAELEKIHTVFLTKNV